MKKLIGFALAVLSLSSLSAVAAPVTVLSTAQMNQLMTAPIPLNLINWKVGETANFDVSVGPFGKLGTMVKTVTREEGNAVWISQNADLAIQKDSSEILLDRATGKVLKYIHNGKEEQMPDDEIEVISQDTTEVTVPAGTFPCMHVVAKSKQVQKIELWANPRDTVMEGTLKMVMSAQMEITMELTSFQAVP